ncbi:MAG: hypothetical protein J5J00_01980 [Deltaproteobacteria bacterium]|nr:hypothetical protein [Deltaproteobacteria bacterium]
MTHNAKTLMDYIKDVTAALNKPVNLPAFLSAPIQIPSLSKQRKAPRGIKVKSRNNPANEVSSKNFVIEGTLRPGLHGKFSVCDTDFDIDGNTWIIGSIEYGAHVKVKGQMQADKRLATQMVVLRPS